MDAMQDEQKYTAPALEKGLDIIDVLSSQDHGLTQIDIARTLDRSVGEIYRMLVVLQWLLPDRAFEWLIRKGM